MSHGACIISFKMKELQTLSTEEGVGSILLGSEERRMEHVSLVPERFGPGRADPRQSGRQRGKERTEKGEFCRPLQKKPSISKRWADRHVSGGGGGGQCLTERV